MGTDDMLKLETWIGSSHAVHEDMKRLTCSFMSMGWGVLHAKASKQKINTKSTCESELVGVSEYIPFKIHIINILMGQSYHLKKKVLNQDNQYAMKLEINGRNSCTRNSRHISIRYFFIKDRVDNEEFVIEYCPTKEMIADYFTKPLQGSLLDY